MKRKEYVYILSDTDRKRHIHTRDGKKITDFMVQYEVLIQGKWLPVVRYDTAHGYAHKDIINPDGSKQKVILGEYGYEEALTIADLDVNQNWQAYKSRYMGRHST
ncbi:MAG: hypothetical protein U5R49_19850 [Deltaproteobacteria bacterium]|nr:hypothetical protein [Deltaproteobacteria bacterium]